MDARQKEQQLSQSGDKEGILIGLAENFPLSALLLTWLSTNLIFFLQLRHFCTKHQLLPKPTKQESPRFVYLRDFDPGKMSQDTPQQNLSSKPHVLTLLQGAALPPLPPPWEGLPKRRGMRGRNGRATWGKISAKLWD